MKSFLFRQKKSVLKDTLVPKLVYEMEQYERSLLELGKQQDVRGESSKHCFQSLRCFRNGYQKHLKCRLYETFDSIWIAFLMNHERYKRVNKKIKLKKMEKTNRFDPLCQIHDFYFLFMQILCKYSFNKFGQEGHKSSFIGVFIKDSQDKEAKSL